eukprot:992804-Rhodomonas_salina.2
MEASLLSKQAPSSINGGCVSKNEDDAAINRGSARSRQRECDLGGELVDFAGGVVGGGGHVLLKQYQRWLL